MGKIASSQSLQSLVIEDFKLQRFQVRTHLLQGAVAQLAHALARYAHFSADFL